MRLRLRSKWMFSFLSLILFFLFFQTCFFYLLKKPFLLSSVLALLLLIPLTFLFVRFLIRPILEMNRRTMEWTSGHLDSESPAYPPAYPDDELGDLSR